MDLKGKRLLICEEALEGFHAHYYTWVSSVRRINQHAGCEVLVAANRSVSEPIKEKLDAIPAFSVNSWSGIYNDKPKWLRHLMVFRHNWLIFREVRALFRNTGKVDLVFLPCVRIHHLIAWRLLCLFFLGKKFNRLVCFLLISEAQYNANFSDYTFKRTSCLLGMVMRSFGRLIRDGKVVFGGDSHITCSEFEKLSGVPFKVFPSPCVLSSDDAAMDASEDKETVFTLLGQAFYEKGVDLFQDAALRILEENPQLPVRFIIQWSREVKDFEGKVIEPKEEFRSHPKVRFIAESLNEADYRQCLEETDFMVLPYRRAVYFNRLSGPLVEAACLGIPMIVTERTWLSWAMEKFGAGQTVRDSDAKDLCDVMLSCHTRKRDILTEAKSARKKALEYNSPDRFLECLWS